MPLCHAEFLGHRPSVWRSGTGEPAAWLRHAEFLGHRPGAPALLQLSDGIPDDPVRKIWIHLFALAMQLAAVLPRVISLA